MVQKGSAAPEFTLASDDGGDVTLSELRGRKVVLYFYPKDDTPGCTTEACEFTDSIADFAGMDAAVLGCSPDSPDTHSRFIAKYDLGVRLLSDETHRVMEKYGAWGEKKLYGRTVVGVKRSTVLIDPKGKVAHHWRNVRAKGHAAKVAERLAELRN